MNNFSLFNYAVNSISVGSKSFNIASKFFPPTTRRSIIMLYSWCRYCDDMIDNQLLGFNKNIYYRENNEQRLYHIKTQTQKAYDGLQMNEPAFAAFQEVVIKHNISYSYVMDHIEGFAMDVNNMCYETLDDTLLYCYYVAGTIGIIIAQILGIYDKKILDYACDLGIAFQLTNIARDVIEDSKKNRCYLPNTWLKKLGLTKSNILDIKNRLLLSKIIKQLLIESEKYYKSSSIGLSKLSFCSALPISIAKRIYHKIGIKILKKKSLAWNKRQSSNFLEKIILSFFALYDILILKFKKNSLNRSKNLWQRPIKT